MVKSDRGMNWIRFVARAIALIWACSWTFFGLVSGAGGGWKGVFTNLPNALPGLLFLLGTLIALRWEAMGGLILLLWGLLAFFFFHAGENVFVLTMVVLPAFVAGILFLICWRKSTIRTVL